MPSAPAPPAIQEITTSEALEAAADSWSREPAIALDTEFVRERTFFAQLGLVQVADSQRCYLVDPVAVANLDPLARVLGDERVVKVAHSVSEDLEVLYHELGDFPRPVFDTQVAAAFTGQDASMGYRRLVEDFFDVELAKGQTRTNWLKRPLTPEQKVYAARDVQYLLPAYQRLVPELESTDRLGWVYEETERRADPERILPDPNTVYHRLSGTGRLDPRRLATAQRLAAWRERQARERDLPRNFVLRESALLAIARQLPSRPEELESIPDLAPKQRDRLADRILQLVAEVQRLPKSELPPRVPSLPRSGGERRKLDQLVSRVRQRADELGIPATALASRRELKEFLLSTRGQRPDPPPPPFDGWRWDVVGEDLLSVL